MGPNPAPEVRADPAIRVTPTVKERLAALVEAKQRETGRRNVTYSEIIGDLLAKRGAA